MQPRDSNIGLNGGAAPRQILTNGNNSKLNINMQYHAAAQAPQQTDSRQVLLQVQQQQGAANGRNLNHHQH